MNQSTSDNEQNTITCLLQAINDTQGTIRAYDVKAQSVGALLAVAVGVINFDFLHNPTSLVKGLTIVTSVVGMLSLFLLGGVLFAISNPVANLRLGKADAKGTYYLHGMNKSDSKTLEEMAALALNTNWVQELMFELMKISNIRDEKHYFFGYALKASIATFLLTAILLIVSVLKT